MKPIVNFKGITDIYALSDSHQDTRKTRTILSEAVKAAQKNDNVLLLNCGDMFKGIYPKGLEADSFVKAKELAPKLEMVMTLGNNDFGFNSNSLQYLINTVKKFADAGIKTVCANIFDTSTGKRPDWIQPYAIVERDGDKNFITGFCINNINSTEIMPKPQTEVLEEIKTAIEKEKPDNVIILNHDYLPSSKAILNKAKEMKFPADIIIGGHDHKPMGHLHPENNIYYPPAFSEGIIHFKLNKQDNFKKVQDLKLIKEEDLTPSKEMIGNLSKYEQESKLLEPIAPCRIKFTKEYSNPCSLGSFLADEIKKMLDTDICVFSTGLLVKPLPYKDSPLTNYDFQKTMMAKLPIKKVELTPSVLKEMFEHSFKNRTTDIPGNAKFLQASSNLKIKGICDKTNNKYTVEEIYINNEPILSTDKKIYCAIDEYISNGGQGFKMLKQISKEDTSLKIDEAFKQALSVTALGYPKGSLYPNYEIEERVV